MVYKRIIFPFFTVSSFITVKSVYYLLAYPAVSICAQAPFNNMQRKTPQEDQGLFRKSISNLSKGIISSENQ